MNLDYIDRHSTSMFRVIDYLNRYCMFLILVNITVLAKGILSGVATCVTTLGKYYIP